MAKTGLTKEKSKMKFSWQNFDRKFLIEVIENSDKPESFKESARNCLDDKERLIGKMNLIAPVPTVNIVQLLSRIA